MYDSSKDDKIHITVEEIPEFEELGGFAKNQTIYFAQKLDIDVSLNLNSTDLIDPYILKFILPKQEFYASSKNVYLTPIKIKG
jgi:hypothetical protein